MRYILREDSTDPFIVRLHLNRPEQLNALTPEMMVELRDAIRDVASSDARILILGGEGRSFSAGVDLKVVASAAYTPAVAASFAEDAREVVQLLETMPQVSIGRVHGHCFTGGLELAFGCDLIVASLDAIFSDTHAKYGLAPRWGMSQHLYRRVGSQRAREMSFTARRIDALEAERIGLILKAVPGDDLDRHIDGLAREIIANSADSIAAYKTLFRAAENMGLDQGVSVEAELQMKLRDRTSGIASFNKE